MSVYVADVEADKENKEKKVESKEEVAKLEKQETQKILKVQDKVFKQIKDGVKSSALSLIIFGASGDLAKRKTFPAIYDCYIENCLSDDFNCVGYGRTKLQDKEYKEKISYKLKGKQVNDFLNHCTYISGKSYSDDESFKKLAEYLNKIENNKKYNGKVNRLFYLAIPPKVFIDVCKQIKKYLYINNDKGWTRVIIEKPFGNDLDSCNKLNKSINNYLSEKEIFRVDHYLAKEMIQNIICFRFANTIWDIIWNRKYVKCVKIVMKETIGILFIRTFIYINTTPFLIRY